ncbi:MAG: ion transporter [Gammaproteobacteria bacterium]|nr:ion transporter [Gammaproteobacteria bacterium]
MVTPAILEKLTGKRRQAANFIESNKVVSGVIALILINAVTLGLETDQEAIENYGGILHTIDTLILIIFTVELMIKFYAYRLDFFRSGWNIFDLLIVGIAWIPASGPFAILRALRILRVLRLLSVVPQMRRVLTAIARSIPGMLSVIGVLCLLFYVSAVLTTKLFGQHPSAEMQEWFGSIGASAYTLFQIMTLESWSMGIVRPVMEYFPWAWLFFVPFIIITSFAVLNLFIGIIVDAMQTSHADEAADAEPAKESTVTETTLREDAPGHDKDLSDIQSRISSISREVAALDRMLGSGRHGR